MYKTDFTQQDKKFVLYLHYNGNNSHLFVNGVEQLKFKTKNSEIQRIPLVLGNIPADFSITNATKTGLYGNVYGFALDYVPVNSVTQVFDEKKILYEMFNLIKKGLILILVAIANAKNCLLLNDKKCGVKNNNKQ